MSARGPILQAGIAPPASKTPPRHELVFLEKGVFENIGRHPALQRSPQWDGMRMSNSLALKPNR
jgi:hypothetical protein